MCFLDRHSVFTHLHLGNVTLFCIAGPGAALSRGENHSSGYVNQTGPNNIFTDMDVSVTGQCVPVLSANQYISQGSNVHCKNIDETTPQFIM